MVLLDSISLLAIDPPSLYIDLEGIALGRHGSLSIISLHIAPSNKTYLIDVHTLGSTTFSLTASNGYSLKTVLESTRIPKVIFDIRNDSDALFSLFQISVAGIKDLQLMELASRTGSRRLVHGLARCIENDSGMGLAKENEWRISKELGRRLFAPEKGGRYEVFNERPLKQEIVQYCKNDVALLPVLYRVYNSKLQGAEKAFWRATVRDKTKERVQESQSPSYDGNSKNKALGWDAYDIGQWRDAWNEDILSESMWGQ